MSQPMKSEVQMWFDLVLRPREGEHNWLYTCKAVETPLLQWDGCTVSHDELLADARFVFGRLAQQLSFQQLTCWKMLYTLSEPLSVRYFDTLRRQILPTGCEKMTIHVDASWVYAWLHEQAYPSLAEAQMEIDIATRVTGRKGK